MRARDDAPEDLQRCRHRLGKLLIRRGHHHAGRNWTQAHRAWLKTLAWEHAAERQVVEDYLLAIDQVQARLADLDTHLAALAETAPYAGPVAWLRCFRGIDTLTAMTIVAELHDFRRFLTPRALMAYLGLVPSEHSSGGQTSRGRITKTGNGLVRRVLTEAAWHYQHRPGLGAALARRRAGQPPGVIAIADKAQHRLCRRFRRLTAEHKPAPKVAVAICAGIGGIRLGRAAWTATRLIAASRFRGEARTAKSTDAPRHDSEDRRASYATGPCARTRAPRLHVLSTKDCHACAASVGRGNHRISA